MISEKKPDDRSQNAVRDGKFGSAEGILSARSAERHPPALQRAVCSKETFGEGRNMPRPDRKAADSLTPPHPPREHGKNLGEGRAESRGRSGGGAEPRGRSCRNKGPGRSSCAAKGQRDAEAIDEMGA